MARDGFTRRELLRLRTRGKPASPQPATPKTITPTDLVKPGQRLPDVISWLDPEMRATPRRAGADATFPLLRPPGAIAEADFLVACTRCGDCASACPHDAIRNAPARLREASGTPIVDPHVSPCLMCEDLPCITACETGALRSEAPAALGTAHVQPLDCLNRLSSSCSVCVERCPVPGVMAFLGDLPSVDGAMCTGCGICQHVCPAPTNAIVLLPNADRPTPAQLASTLTSEPTEPPEPEIVLPDLHEAELDEQGLRALFHDLSSAAEIEGVRVKQAAAERASTGQVTASDALELLLARRVRGVQIRYRYQGESWCDTIMASPHGHRVVRLADPVRPAGLD